MTGKDNFKWLVNDINDSLILEIFYKNGSVYESYGVFNVIDVLETPCDELEISTGNINDLTNLLTLGVVRFTPIRNSSDILEVPFRKLHLLYYNAMMLCSGEEKKMIPFVDLDTFSIIDGTVRNDLLVFSATIVNPSDDLRQVIDIAKEYGNCGMQEKFNLLNKITEINHRRVVNEQKEKNLSKYIY